MVPLFLSALTEVMLCCSVWKYIMRPNKGVVDQLSSYKGYIKCHSKIARIPSNTNS